MLAEVISKRKLICYDANSPKLVYLLMVTVFPFEVQFIPNLGIVKPEPRTLVSFQCTVKDLQFIHSVQTTKKKKAAGLSSCQLQLVLTGNGHTLRDRRDYAVL